MPDRDVVVIGSGPNGLAAAVVLARSGLSTLVLEAKGFPGGGMRTEELTLPGFRHDVCSTVHPLGVASPLFRALELERHGLSWVDPPAPLAHVVDEGRVVMQERSIEVTAAQFGDSGPAYERLLGPYVERFDLFCRSILAPLRLPPDPLFLARFGMYALRSMQGLKSVLPDPAACALLSGMAAHAMLPLDAAATASFGLVLAASGHAVGWPLARGGSQAITSALLAELTSLGGELELNHPVERFDALPKARAYLFDVTPRQLLRIAGNVLPSAYRRRLRRYRYGPGVCKVDWALRGPVPWRDPRCRRAATVHLSGSLDAVAKAEAEVHAGRVADRPFVLFVQPSLFDPLRAPEGMHTAWAYCHVPHGTNHDASQAIEAEIERFAPGFGSLILARSVRTPRDVEHHNENYVGGDINGGSARLSQLFFRPVFKLDPYATAREDVFLCSSSTPPGGGVHGMCGYWAARSALSRVFQQKLAPELELGRAPSSDRSTRLVPASVK